MANSPGGKDRPTDSSNAPADKNSTHPSGSSVARPVPSSSSRTNTSESHVPAVQFDASQTLGYMSMFSGLQAISRSYRNPEGTLNLAQIENQNHIINQNYDQADSDVAAADKPASLADRNDASTPLEPRTQQQVFTSIKEATDSTTEASDKVANYVRTREVKKDKLKFYEAQLQNSRDLIKQHREDADDNTLDAEERQDCREAIPVKRKRMNEWINKVFNLRDNLMLEKREEMIRRLREGYEGGPKLFEDEEELSDNASDFDVKDEPSDDSFSTTPITDKKRKASDKVDSGAKPKKLKAKAKADSDVEEGTPKVPKKATRSLRQSVLTPKAKGGKYVDPGTDSEPEGENTADNIDTDADSKSEDGGGKGKKKREPAISATNPKSVTYTNRVPIPEWDEPQRSERSRRSNTVKPYDKGNQHADKNAAPRQRKDALAVIDKNTIALSEGRAPASYRSSPFDGNYNYWNIIYLQNESYILAKKAGLKAMKTLKSAGGSLDPLSDTEDENHNEDVEKAVENLQELWKSMKHAADKATAGADKAKGSQSKTSAAEASAKKKRNNVWEKLKKSNLSKSLDGASDFDGDSSSTSAVS